MTGLLLWRFCVRCITFCGNCGKMEPFYSLVLAFGLNSALEGRRFDVVGKLPEEMGIMILR